VALELAAKGVSADELKRAIVPKLKRIEEYRRSNGYWLNNVLLTAREYPQRFDWARTMVTDLESVTVAEINELAKAYLKAETAVRLLVLPEPPPTPEPTP